MRNKKVKTLALMVSVLLAIGCVAGGTLAWLADSTTQKVNTFTVGNVDVDLTETEREYQIVPGVDIDKDPQVDLLTPSTGEPVDTYVFVQVVEENWPEYKDGGTRKVNYTIDPQWTEVSPVGSDVAGKVYCLTNAAIPAASIPDIDNNVLADNKVTVSNTLTKEECEAIAAAQPKLTFKAFAVQAAGSDSVAAAWAKVEAKAIKTVR